MVPDPEQAARMHEQILQVASSGCPAWSRSASRRRSRWTGIRSNDPILFEDFPLPPGQMPKMRRYKWIGPGYFEAMRHRLVAGRTMTWTDVYDRAPVAIVSENLARETWKTPAAAIGRRIRRRRQIRGVEIIGVVGDERDDGLAQAPPTVVYWPLLMNDFWGEPVRVSRSQAYAVRSPRAGRARVREGDPAGRLVGQSEPAAGQRADAQHDQRGLDGADLVHARHARPSQPPSRCCSAWSACTASSPTSQRSERARWASASRSARSRATVVRLFVRQGLALTGVGLAVGLVGAVAFTRLMATMLYGVSPVDPPTFVAVAGGLGAVALLATYLPARRAARVDPVVALRSDT